MALKYRQKIPILAINVWQFLLAHCANLLLKTIVSPMLIHVPNLAAFLASLKSAEKVISTNSHLI